MTAISFFSRHPRADLSAYIDEQLSPKRRVAIETHLSRCPACSAKVDDLWATQSALAALPQANAPRSFALTPQHLAEPARPAPRRPEPVAPAFFGMRIASAGIAVALALVFVADLGGGSSSTGGDDSGAPAALSNAYDSAAPAPEAASGGDTFAGNAPIPSATEVEKDIGPGDTLLPTHAAGVAGVAPSGEPVATPAPDEVQSAAESPTAPPAAVAGIPTTDAEGTGTDRDGSPPTFELAANPVADSALTGDNNDGLSALQIAEIVLAVTLAVAVTGGFLLPLALRRNR